MVEDIISDSRLEFPLVVMVDKSDLRDQNSGPDCLFAA